MALCATALLWVFGTLMVAQVHGQTLVGAATIAAVSALGGLIAWAIYHTISRRNNGLGIFTLAATVTLTTSHQNVLPLNEALTQQASAVVILALTSVVFGLMSRERPKGQGHTAGSPLWDAELDPPSPG